MRRVAWAAVLLGAALTAHAYQPAAKDMASWTSHAMQKARESLRDPPSGRFRNTYVSEWHDDHDDVTKVVLCGEVNAKNAYGGYTGFQRFVADEDGAIFGSAIYGWDMFCSRPLRKVK